MQLSRRSLLAGLLATAVTPMRLPGREVKQASGYCYLVLDDIPLKSFAGRTPIGWAMHSAAKGELVAVALGSRP